MKYIKLLIKIILISISTLGICVIIYFLAARGLSNITVNKVQEEPQEFTMYLTTNGMHTDFVFPVKSDLIDWSKELKFEHTKGQRRNFAYIALGWGDKGFFLDVEDWDNVKPGIAINAAFGLGTTAIHSTYLSNIELDENTREVKLSKQQYQILIDYILSSFKRDTNNNVINIKTDKAYGLNDSFYEGEGKYSFLYTCNTWANSGLKKAKMKACLWTPFQEGIFRKYNL
ncbi:TIGR02117 family protein [Myroides odoratimimus]|uniref:TIGR02117 family protein n=1 Tax=Myroides odoratimimus TaxID=76832 RepID=UPI001CE119C4|nr:TIGR02117 family protein [Myroides odoratimimus]MCA4805453.1 TIGR02117 family protein [Myroides odoratimimus]